MSISQHGHAEEFVGEDLKHILYVSDGTIIGPLYLLISYTDSKISELITSLEYSLKGNET